MLFVILERCLLKHDLLERSVKEMKCDGNHQTGKMVAAFTAFSAFAIDQMTEYFFNRDDVDSRFRSVLKHWMFSLRNIILFHMRNIGRLCKQATGRDAAILARPLLRAGAFE